MKYLSVGLDWSGRSALGARLPDIIAACLVGVADIEQLAQVMTVLRHRLKTQCPRKTVEELHGHQMPPEFIAEALRIGQELEMHVGIVMLDKTAAVQQGMLPAPNELHTLTALRIWPAFLGLGQAMRLDYDTDIEGKERQKRFETELKRANSAIYPTQKLKARAFPSHKSDLIQLADVVGYAFARQEKGQKVEPEIARLLREIRNAPNNIIMGPDEWDG